MFEHHLPVFAGFLLGAYSIFAQSTPSRSDSAKVITAWLHTNDWDSAVESVKDHAENIVEVSPAWYQVTEDSIVAPIPGAPVNDPRLTAIVRLSGLLLRPLVMNVTSRGTQPELVRPLFSDAGLRKEHIALLRQLVSDNEYDGLDLDYEGFKIPELPYLANLVEEIASALHGIGKTLAVSLEVQSNDECLPSWRRIGLSADAVRIMTYGQSKPLPGPLADNGWIRENLSRAVRAIPARKLSQGIAVYGLHWNPDGKRESGTWKYYSELAKRKEAKINRDAESKTLWYTYGDENAPETVWYEDAESIKTKMDIGLALGIHRFALWRLGGEDPLIFPVRAPAVGNMPKRR